MIRLNAGSRAVKAAPIYGKCNGAVGNFNAHIVGYPDVDWPTVSRLFVEKLGLDKLKARELELAQTKGCLGTAPEC